MKSSRHNLLMQSMTSSSPPQLTTTALMESIDPALISELSQRKLYGSGYVQRRDKPNLRRRVLIQNSLVSISPCPSPSRTSPDRENVCECQNGTDQVQQQQFDRDEDTHSTSDSINGLSELYDDDGFGYIFPDLSLYDEHSDDDDEDDDYERPPHLEAESDWLDAVLSDLDDEDMPEMIDSHELASPSDSHAALPSSSIPIGMIHTSYGSGPRYPLPRPALDALPSTSPPTSEEEMDDSTTALDDGLPPYFDPDDGSSIYSDESSEPSTPLSHSLLRSGLPSFPNHYHHPRPSPVDVHSEVAEDHHVGVVAHSRHSLAQSYSEARAHGSGLGDDSANRAASRAVMNANGGNEDDDEIERNAGVLGARTLLKNVHAQQQQQQRQQRHAAHDYFSSCHFSGRPFDTY